MTLNVFTHRAVVLFDGVWQVAMGQKCGYDFVFTHNGRIEFAQEGFWYTISYTCSDEAVEQEIVRANISDLKNKKMK